MADTSLYTREAIRLVVGDGACDIPPIKSHRRYICVFTENISHLQDISHLYIARYAHIASPQVIKEVETMKITVWTKQHENVAEIIEKEGHYTAKRHIIAKTADDHEGLVLRCYDWLVRHLPDKPDDADYPVWVSMEKEATMLLQPGFVMLELEIDEEIITKSMLKSGQPSQIMPIFPLMKRTENAMLKCWRNTAQTI